MKKFLIIVVTLSLGLVRVAAQGQLPAPAARTVGYEKDVKPLLAQSCYGCHGPEVQQSGLRLDLRQTRCGAVTTGR